MGTIGPNGPHLVPVVFAVTGDHLYTAVDHKPKTTRRLQRLVNIARQPRIALLVDGYDDNWDRLWWVRADGTARVLGPDDEIAIPLRLLAAKYPQYRDRTPDGPVVAVTIDHWVGWEAAS
jgi:PPOX class probable F420-dependent enzyme